MKNVFKKAAIAAALAGAGFAASAAPVIGIANIGFSKVLITFGEIDWNSPLNPGFDVSATYGKFSTDTDGNTGSFADPVFTLTQSVTQGSVQDMSLNPFDGNYVPLGVINVANFLSFAAKPTWAFTATSLVTGTAGTPYLLNQSGPNVSAVITVNGTVCDMATSGLATVCDLADDVTKWTAIFSAQYTNTTIAGIFATILGPDGIPLTADDGALANNGWSATVEASKIPEPGSLALLGLGLVGLAATRRRAVK